MSRIVGIDLGTTYSCVAIPEERMDEGFLTVKKCPGCSVVLDRLKRRITPSVVAEDKNGNIVTGYPAKGRAGFFPEPVMFAKRSMGEDATFRLDKQGSLAPEEVSAHVLRGLKEMAERRLGEPVTEAVVTVPAYFSLKAKQMTEKAGEMAGLKVAQIAQEPVAAALMYCAGDGRDPLRIMTYDLGGGTFDVAVLEKRDGTIGTDSILAFDGDRFMGGYDFDKALAFWILDRLQDGGYDLDPEDSVMFAKLMVYAEQAKIALSRSEEYTINEPSTGIQDRNGEGVVLEMELDRKTFEDMIRPQIAYTIDICRRALSEKASKPIRPDEIDEIVMVGGSSRIPLVSEMLEDAFGKKPILVEPDLCVALGAAILAGAKGKTYGCLKLDSIPRETDLPSLAVTGRIVPSGELREGGIAGCVVGLRADDGSFDASRTVSEDGGFVFDSVPLVPDETSGFRIRVDSPEGRRLEEHRFSVVHREDGGEAGLVESVTNLLSKPLGILTADGPCEVVPVRTPLPYETLLQAKTRDASGCIRIPVVEENTPIGEIVMDEIPKTLHVGSTVEITLKIQENYQILGTAYVPALSRESKVAIDIPVPPRKSLEELRADFETLAERAEDVKSAAGPGALFGNAKVKRLDERMERCRELFGQRSPEPLKIQDCLHEIESLVREIGAGWRPDPPRAVFTRKAEEAGEWIARLVRKKPEARKDGHDKRLEAIREEADGAYASQDGPAWKEAFRKVAKLCDDLKDLADEGGGGGGSPPPPDPAQLLMALGQELGALEERAKQEGKYAEFANDFKDMADSLKKIDPEASDAMTRIRDWYFTKYQDLRRRMNAPETTGYVGLG